MSVPQAEQARQRQVCIDHTTQYRFDSPVFLEPHVLKFSPQYSLHQKIITHSLDISPQPAGSENIIDPEGNYVRLCWFEGEHEELKIRSVISMKLRPYNPYGFLFHPGSASSLPMCYSAEQQQLLKPALFEPWAQQVSVYAQECLHASDNHTSRFIAELMNRIHNDFLYRPRREGYAKTPVELLESREGSCRDFCRFFMACARSVGLASRFVSGYFVGETDEPSELHAWTELYLPGAGWRGYDPTHNIADYGTHIALAKSVSPEQSLPLVGNYRGRAKSTLETTLLLNNEQSGQ